MHLTIRHLAFLVTSRSKGGTCQVILQIQLYVVLVPQEIHHNFESLVRCDEALNVMLVLLCPSQSSIREPDDAECDATSISCLLQPFRPQCSSYHLARDYFRVLRLVYSPLAAQNPGADAGPQARRRGRKVSLPCGVLESEAIRET